MSQAFRNHRKCWKCGQAVAHYRKYIGGRRCSLSRAYPQLAVSVNRHGQGPRIIIVRKRDPLVPIKHLVLKNGHWTVCKGSLTPN